MEATKLKILQATERLIMEYGWEKVTFRMITTEAGVNLAAINYHFGSRDALEDVLLPRLTGPLDEKRLQRLREFQSQTTLHDMDVKEIIRCFLEPLLEFSRENPNHFRLIQHFFNGIENKDKLKNHFRESLDVINRQFIEVLVQALPGVPRERVLVLFVLLFESCHVMLNKDAFTDFTNSVGLSISQEIFLEEMVNHFANSFHLLKNSTAPVI